MSRITTDLERERVLKQLRRELLVKLEQAVETAARSWSFECSALFRGDASRPAGP